MIPSRMISVIAAIGLHGAALAAEGEVGVELNKLESREDACRAYLVIENEAGAAFEALALDLVVFDGGGVIVERLAVELAPLAAGKTSVKAFDLAGLDCAEAGRFLMNGVLACETAEGPREDCANLVAPSARGALSFIE